MKALLKLVSSTSSFQKSILGSYFVRPMLFCNHNSWYSSQITYTSVMSWNPYSHTIPNFKFYSLDSFAVIIKFLHLAAEFAMFFFANCLTSWCLSSFSALITNKAAAMAILNHSPYTCWNDRCLLSELCVTNTGSGLGHFRLRSLGQRIRVRICVT